MSAADETPVTGAIRVGILGFGAIAAMHARALAELRPRVDLVAYSGGSPERVEEMLRESGWDGAERRQPRDLLDAEDVDVVAICAPSAAHGQLALEALRRGKHVVVEKPMAIDVADAEEIDRIAQERGLIVSVVSQRRFESAHQYAKALLDSGALGDVVLATTTVPWYRDAPYFAAAAWRTESSEGGGALMNQGVHNVDLLDWLCGPVDSVTAQTATREDAGDTDATTVATVRFSSGALGTIITTVDAFPGGAATVSVHTSKGHIVLGQDEVVEWSVDAPPPPLAGGGVGHGGADPLAIGHVGHLRQWADVIDALVAHRAPAIGSADGVRTVRLLRAIQEAARLGCMVTISPSPDPGPVG